jgi:hypothetical protein
VCLGDVIFVAGIQKLWAILQKISQLEMKYDVAVPPPSLPIAK